MKKMSKLLAVMLVLVMVLAMFAGCNNQDTPSTTGAISTRTSPPSLPPLPTTWRSLT